MGYTQQFAHYVVQRDDIPLSEKDLRASYTAILDWLSAAIVGHNEDSVQISYQYALEMGGSGKCSVIGFPEKVSPLSAALVNSMASHSQDFDDIHDYLPMHLESPVIGAALAAAQHVGASGKEFIIGMLRGIQVTCALSKGLTLTPGWIGSAVLGIFGSAAAGGYILGLTEEQMANAIGLAAGCASGLQYNMGVMAKPYQVAHAARTGLECAFLAKKDFTGKTVILDEEKPYLELISDKVDREVMMEYLNGPYAVHELRYKQFPCGAPTHPGIINCGTLAKEYDLKLEDLDHVDLYTYPRGGRLTGTPSLPNTGLEGKFSIIFCAAASFFSRGVVDASTFTDEVLNRPEIHEFVSKITLRTEQQYNDTRGGRAELFLKDGRVLKMETKLFGKGVRLEDQVVQVSNKFHVATDKLFGVDTANAVEAAVESIDSAADVDTFFNSLPAQF